MSHERRSRTEDLSALCDHLRSERLLIGCEQAALQNLNSKVQNELTELYKLIWVCRHERVALHKLINSDPSVSPDNCNQLMLAINSTQFSEGYKGLGHYISSISNLFQILLKAPRTMAEFLNATEKLSLNVSLKELNRAIFNVIYGSCVFLFDERQMLDLLAHLISLQLLSNPDPRRLLRKGNITFSRMYRYFSEELSSAKIFLTAALHEPVMFLLSQDELFLDIDPLKSPIRFPAAERARRFGTDETSRFYKERVSKHRQIIVEKLVTIGVKFIEAIRLAMSCFPPSFTWLVRQLNTSLIERKHVTKDEAALICTDLIFTCFLCSAIINPEPLGIISDTPISHISRFNLIQIGQILQTLALLPYERAPPYMEDILLRFDQSAMAQVVHSVLNSDSISLELVFPNIVSNTDGLEVYRRKSSVGTLQELNIIQLYLKSSAVDDISDAFIRKTIKNILKKLPSEFVKPLEPTNTFNTEIKNINNVKSTPTRSNSSGKLRNLADKVQNVASKGHQRLMQNTSQGLRLQQRITQSTSSNFQQPSTSPNGISILDNDFYPKQTEAYIIPIFEDVTPIGLASEETIMQNVVCFRPRKHRNSETKKRAGFVQVAESVVSDRTTDVVSDEEDESAEVAGGSSCSSNDNENGDEEVDDPRDDEAEDDDAEEDISTLPDNLSDVVPISANVSARGSPCLSGERNSGRDTPFSGNAQDQNDNLAISSIVAGAATLLIDHRRMLPTIPVSVRKQNQEGLDEKFGKFGLPPQDTFRYHDETYSLVSDSWSTDVVASDNEGFNESRNDAVANNQVLNFPPAPILPPPALLVGLQSANKQPQQNLFQFQNPFLPNNNNNGLDHNLFSNCSSTSAPNIFNNNANVLNNFAINNNSNNQLLFDMDNNEDEEINRVLAAENEPVQQSSQLMACNHSSINLTPREVPHFDPKNITQCRAFIDAKRKLRLVLSSASNVPKFNHFMTMMTPKKENKFKNYDRLMPERSNLLPSSHHLVKSEESCKINAINSSALPYDEGKKLNEFLQILLAESINSRERAQTARIREVQRCLIIFDSWGIRKLLKTLKDENRTRTSYLLYLQQSKLTLLQLNYYLSRTKIRIQREKFLTSECLIEILVRFTLEKKDLFLRQFIYDFQQLNAQDEKIEAVDKALSFLYECFLVEPMWRCATLESLEYARKSMERALMAHIYIFALYPNGDADHCRDELFFTSMQRLAASLTVSHPDLDIPKKFHGECPWPSAQAEIAIINAYKSPRDKLACIVRCCETIENLIALSSSNRGDNASADDILPVLVYVLLQANPPTLLSNIQYVDDFYASRMQGEEAYWWTQFTSSVEFIKQLLTKF